MGLRGHQGEDETSGLSPGPYCTAFAKLLSVLPCRFFRDNGAAPRSPALTSTITHCAREGADGQAVVCPLLRGSLATRGVAPKQHRGARININSHLRAREALNGHRSARSYGVAWQREGSRQNSRRAPACFLSGISGGRGCRRIWRGVVLVYWFGGAMLLDRLGPPGRCSGCWPHDGEVAGGAVADLV
jgi:hypothetical protein